MLPFGVTVLALLGIGVGSMPAPLAGLVLTGLFTTALQAYATRLPSYCLNAVVMFIGAFCACANEYATGMPTVTVLVPIIVVQAPGAGAFTSVLDSMNSGMRRGDVSGHLPALAVADVWFHLLSITRSV